MPRLGKAGLKRVANFLNRENYLLLLIVIAPTLIATLYYGLIASDVYVSESRFVVRAQQKQPSPNLLGSLLQGGALGNSASDAYPVREYVVSRDALKALDADHLVSRAYSERGADFLSRFPKLDFDRSFEAFYRYYQRQVGIDLDPASGIATLTVRAFTPEDAVKLNERLIDLSETLVNRLNERAQGDMLRFAQSELERAQAVAKNASLAISGYRSRQGVFDPEQQSALQLQQLSKLQDRLIQAQTQLAQLVAISPQNSQVSALRSTVQSLQRAIDNATSNVTGPNGSLSKKAPDYERLALDQAFANKQLASALDFFEVTRSDASRKRLYLERLVQPNAPDVAIEPLRLRSIATVFVCGLIAWGILTLLLAGVREHHD
jgi:capsular polysaccharide transport system permease protein